MQYIVRLLSMITSCDLQLYAFICSLEDLRQKINSGVGRVDVEESEISIGSFCVAKFSEDDK